MAELKWTTERIYDEAKKYRSRNEWRRCSVGSYTRAGIIGIREDVCRAAGLGKPNKPCGFWNNKDNVLNEARKYKTKIDFARGSASAYCAAVKHKYIDEIAEMFGYTELKKPSYYWTYERCRNILFDIHRKSNTRCVKSTIRKFREENNGGYQACRINNWLYQFRLDLHQADLEEMKQAA